MEQEIENKLKEVYNSNIKIRCNYIDFRKYEIILTIEVYRQEFYKTDFVYTYDVSKAFNYNISEIERQIDKKIINYYKEMI